MDLVALADNAQSPMPFAQMHLLARGKSALPF